MWSDEGLIWSDQGLICSDELLIWTNEGLIRSDEGLIHTIIRRPEGPGQRRVEKFHSSCDALVRASGRRRSVDDALKRDVQKWLQFLLSSRPIDLVPRWQSALLAKETMLIIKINELIGPR